MDERIEKILQDVYALDPALREKEVDMRKLIEKLMASRPDTQFDRAFEKELKKKLRLEFAKNKTKKPVVLYPMLKRRWVFGMAAAILVAILFIPRFSRMNIFQEPREKQADGRKSVTRLADNIHQPVSPRGKDERSEDAKKLPQKKPLKVQQESIENENFNLNEISGGLTATDAAVHEEIKSMPSSTLARSEKDSPQAPDQFRRFGNPEGFNTESYTTIHENDFLKAIDNPLSTFSIDVDTASYANMRRFLSSSTLPPQDAVRIEELINYFPYDYPLPAKDEAFSIHTETASCPWNLEHKLVLIGLKGKDIPRDQLPPSNLVFLLDVSGSMDEPNKLPLLKQAFKLLVKELSPEDRVAIVVYAGAAGLVLPSTPGDRKRDILEAIDNLEAGGTTAGGAGLRLAYEIAYKNFKDKGNNRVILATDGDFNIGPSSDAEMERLIEVERKKGIFLTVLGFGMGNYKDSKMEILADKGNGNYAYIDSLLEAKKVLSNDVRKTLFTIAKDVKIQVEFNPARVGSYRLIGYENRLMKKEDFEDDTKDAGEIGCGHTVTALYEIVPEKGDQKEAKPLKYQTTQVKTDAKKSGELLTVHIRYKKPSEDKSSLISRTLADQDMDISRTSENFRFASVVAEFGMLLRDSKYKAGSSFPSLLQRARTSLGMDSEGYRQEFLKLAQTAQILLQNRQDGEK